MLENEITIGEKKFKVWNENDIQRMTLTLKEARELAFKGLTNTEEQATKKINIRLIHKELIIFKSKRLMEIINIVANMGPDWTLVEKYESTNININEVLLVKNILECTMNFVQHPNKKSVLFLSLRSDHSDNFWLKPQKSFVIAIEESMDSIKSLVDNQFHINKLSKIKKTINKVYKKLSVFF